MLAALQNILILSKLCQMTIINSVPYKPCDYDSMYIYILYAQRTESHSVNFSWLFVYVCNMWRILELHTLIGDPSEYQYYPK